MLARAHKMLAPNTKTKCLFHSSSEASVSVKFPSTQKVTGDAAMFAEKCQAAVAIYIPQMTVIV